jgi:S-DNA-T family DNA segregation ATPase FtsK/SpoIIIE
MGAVRRAGAAALREAWWWLYALWRLVRRFPGQVLVGAAGLWLLAVLAPGRATTFTVVVVVTVLMLRGWAVTHRVSFDQVLQRPLLWGWRQLWMRRHWRRVAVMCGLGVSEPVPLGRDSRAERRGDRLVVPGLLRVRVQGPRVRLLVRLLCGQTFDDVEKAGERLRAAVGAGRVRVDPVGANQVLVTFTIGDLLATAFTARQPSGGSAVSLDRVWMGACEDGADWWLPVGPHTLVAGCSGAGKGSVFWSFLFGLAPAVRAGLVRLHGVDLKGGMEILMGERLFTMRATTAAEAVLLLETLVVEMQARTHRYAGHVRSHRATVAEPLQVVMIDELAALTAYCPERDLQRRGELAINLLCSQGRAPGFVVFACLQDPRKEVIPARGLFTQMIGLRLKDLSETAMVLGEAAVTSGAHCHRISRHTPGMGYVVPEDGGYPIRVRAGQASDHAIRSVAARFATPVQQTVVVPAVLEDERRPVRRARSGSGAV